MRAATFSGASGGGSAGGRIAAAASALAAAGGEESVSDLAARFGNAPRLPASCGG